MATRNSIRTLTVAAGAVIGLAAVASAQPTVIHMSGATLLENYVKARAATVDFIDVDGDFLARGIPNASGADQLAPFFIPVDCGDAAEATYPASMHWAYFYSSVGSTRGLQELIDNGKGWNAGNSTNAFMSKSVRSKAFFNRYQYINGGIGFDDATNPDDMPGVQNYINDGNSGGFIYRQQRDDGSNPSPFAAVFTFPNDASTSPGPGGCTVSHTAAVGVDIAILDVPVFYAVRQPSGSQATGYFREPGDLGYGDNPITPRNPDGTAATGSASNLSAKLASLTPTAGSPAAVAGVTAANLNVDSPDANTIYDTPLFFAPIAPIGNFGTGMEGIGGKSGILMTDLQSLFVTGRLTTGENLVAVTRDSGSGTRNGWNNSIGTDPSWGVGENVGARNNTTGNTGADRLGPNYRPSNKGGNPRVENNVYNHRLAIGYVGPERGLVNSGSSQDVDLPWLATGHCDILSVANNLANYGGSMNPSRPTLDSILDNDVVATRWVIGGPASLGTYGDPTAAPASKGGLGWMEPFQDTNTNTMYDMGEPFNDINNNGVRDAVETRPAAIDMVGYPKMRNVEAAALINNITRSITAFVDLPGSDQTVFTPGELAATQYILNGALPRVQTLSEPTNLAVNAAFNSSLQDFIRNQAGNIQDDPAYATFGSNVGGSTSNSPAGKVPTRFVPAAGMSTYSDAAFNADGDKYVGYGTDGTDGPTIAYEANLPIANWVAGDFNADGLRNWNDVDGLVGAWRLRQGMGSWAPPAGASGALATADGDASNFAYSAADFCIEIVGDFNGDGSHTLADVRYFADGLAIGPVSGKLNRFEGFKRVDEASDAAGGDLNFFGTILGNGASVANNINAYQAGYSAADVSGSGKQARGWAPVGADGRVNGADIDFVWAQLRATDNLGNVAIDGGEIDWATELDEAALTDLSADVTGDLKINAADVAYIVETVLCTNFGDVNLDGMVDASDLSGLPAFGSAAGWAQGDMNGDGLYTMADQSIITGNAGLGRPCCPGDFNGDTLVDLADLIAFNTAWQPNIGTVQPIGTNGDYNRDGVVDLADLIAFNTDWQPNIGQSCN